MNKEGPGSPTDEIWGAITEGSITLDLRAAAGGGGGGGERNGGGRLRRRFLDDVAATFGVEMGVMREGRAGILTLSF